MNAPTRRPAWLAFALGAAGITALYASALTTGFLNDDHVFLEQARTRSLLDALVHPGGIANYFRPLAREVHFALMTQIAGMHPLPYHVVNLAGLLVAAWLLFDLLLPLVPITAAAAGTLWFLTLPLMRVDVLWISCSQDVFALVGSLAAFALWRRGRDRLAMLAYLGAVLSKQSSLPLPALLFFWSWRVQGEDARATAKRLVPFALPLLVWALGEAHVRRAAPLTATRFDFSLSAFAAGYAHLVQSLLGLEAPDGLWQALLTAGPSLLALALLAPIALWLPAQSPEAAPVPRGLVAFALAWLVLFGLMPGPVSPTWSAYYYTLCAVGGAVLVALAARRMTRLGWLALLMALLWWNAAVSSVPSFAIADRAWGWTGHFTSWYFERGARISKQLREALLRSEPHPQRGTRFFFATLPGWAGFQMGNGPAIRDAYLDRSLESFFYSQFSETTAADHPCRFLFWNGVDFEHLYANARDPYFQVGCDLLLLERPHGARHAFHRGLAAGEDANDHAYFLGWASLWDGDRAAAEQAWKAFGAADDTTMYIAWLRAARTQLDARDSLAARRSLLSAVRAGVGRPEAHAVLGELLRGRNAKYALLETRIAAHLDPLDWLARRDLVEGLVAARLDVPARHELTELQRIEANWQTDTLTARLAETLARRAPDATSVVTFARTGTRIAH